MTKTDKQLDIKDKALDKLDGNKKLVMDAYHATRGNITTSCSVVGIGRATFYMWLDNDPEFKLAKEEADGELNDEIRDVLISKAAEADMTAVIFYLKSRHPDFKPQPFAAGAEFKDGDKTMRVIISRGEDE